MYSTNDPVYFNGSFHFRIVCSTLCRLFTCTVYVALVEGFLLAEPMELCVTDFHLHSICSADRWFLFCTLSSAGKKLLPSQLMCHCVMAFHSLSYVALSDGFSFAQFM